MQVLNIPTTPELLERWRGYLAPPRQPFFLSVAEAADCPSEARATAKLTPEERDTYAVWGLDHAAERVVWLTREQWNALPATEQRQLLQLQVRHGRGNVPLGKQFQDLLPDLPAGRFLWTPEQLTPEILARIVSREAEACQRQQVPQAVWDDVQWLLPRVRELAGTFPQGSAGNCFGAVMAAAGVPDAENEWTQREPFEDFLRQRARKGGQDTAPGTVLVWRSERGVEHAAVTLGQDRSGQGWAFQKPSQCWNTPRQVLKVADVKRLNRVRGWRLERWHLQP